MQITKTRFVTTCQQSLAVGVVVALLAPAANVLSIDVVASVPDSGSTTPLAVTAAAVPVESVEPEVTEHALTESATPSEAPRADAHADEHGHDHAEGHGHGLDSDDVVAADVTTSVRGYGAVGVTWSPEATVKPDEIAVQVRTRSGDEWSEWTQMPYSDEHAPDPGTPDADTSRPGTEPVVIGDVDAVEVRAEGDGTLPDDLQLAVVDPGAVETRQEAPAITTTDDAAVTRARDAAAAEAEQASVPTSAGDIELRSNSVAAAKPTIYSRAQWGADEKIREQGKPSYGTIAAGFVHHTVNANNYTAAEVPGIIRSIYAYHVKSRGWSDIGYNFLVDRFGRIWEGRHGGVDKAVVGAHTLNYNSYSFAMSAIGNFETGTPSEAMITAYGQVMAWKLGMHGISATATNRKVGKGTFRAINGHRDAASTACPGKNLYARLGDIRTRAAALQGKASSPAEPPVAAEPGQEPAPEPQETFTAPVLQSNLIGTAHPDVLVRRASDKKLMVIPTGGLSELTAPSTVYKSMSTKTRVFVSPDLTGDGKADLVTIAKDGSAKVRRGTGKGTFSNSGSTSHKGAKKYSLLTPAGDVNRDGRNDLVGRDKAGNGVALLRTKSGKFLTVKLNVTWKTLSSITGVGDVTGDGYPDFVARRKGSGKALLIRSTGKRTYARPVNLAGSWTNLRDFVGGTDFDADGKQDIVFRNTDGNVWVLPGLGNGTFEPALGPIAKNKSITALSIADLTGDSRPDVLARSAKKVVLLKNSGKFEIGAPISLKINMPTAKAILNAGDWNRDGKGDVMAIRQNGELIVRTGDGMGGLSKSVTIGTGFGGVTNLQAIGDVTRDGHPDLLGVQGGVTTVFPGNGLAKLSPGIPAPGFKAPLARLKTASAYDATQYDWKISVSDVRLAKGTTDLVVRERATGRLFVFENTTSGIGSRRYLGRGLGVYDLAG